MSIVLGLVAAFVAVSPGHLVAQDRLEWHSTTYSDQGGVPDFGRPFHAAASPDGRHLYVVSQFPELLTSFRRTGSGLEALEVRGSGDGGFTFVAASDIAITSDGAFVLVSSFVSGNLLVFARDGSTGLLTPIQDLVFDSLTQLDGVAADEIAVAWGVGPGNTYGLVLLEPVAAKDDGGMMQFGEIPTPDRANDVVVDDRQGWVAWYTERIRIGYGDEERCVVTLDDLAPAVGPDPGITKVNAYFMDNLVLLNIFLSDGSIAEVEVDVFDPDSCTVRSLRVVPLGEDFEALDPAVARFVLHRVVEDTGDAVIEIVEAAVVRAEREERELRARRAHYESRDRRITAEDIRRFGPPGPPDDVIDRALDLEASNLSPNERKQQGTSSAYLYAVTPDPPAIHVYEFSTQSSGCVPSATRLCLNDGRFAVEASYTTTQGGPEQAAAVPVTADTGYLTFFDPDNVEVMVKVLNACGINQSYWVFAAGLTDVQVEMTVTDTETGEVRTYSNRLGEAFQPILDTSAFAGCVGKSWSQPLAEAPPEVLEASAGFEPTKQGCAAGAGSLCLNEERFRITASYETADGSTGTAQALPITGDTGTFWFFDDDNIEVVLKVLDGCGINQRFWVFAGGLTDVRVELTVEDTASGQIRTYTNPLGEAFVPIQDAEAFATCP
jgi:hypothetical protein